MLLHVVRPGENLWSIVTSYGLHPLKKAIQKIVNQNDLASNPYIVPGQQLIIPIEGLYYVVKPGDNLWYISNVFNVPISSLVAYNNIPNPSFIYPGMIIKFPKGSKGNLTNPGQYLICIDAGHQQTPDYEEEPVGPGSTEKSAKVYPGTQGVITKKPEYALNLEVALKIQRLLEQKGYNVLMIRTKNDVNISNSTRATIANDANADLCVHIHADGSTSPEVNGISVLYPPYGTPSIGTQNSEKSEALAKDLLDELITATGANSIGAIPNSDITVFQWSKIPTALVEMGFMTNPEEDVKLSNPQYQNKLAQGVVRGIEDYLLNND